MVTAGSEPPPDKPPPDVPPTEPPAPEPPPEKTPGQLAYEAYGGSIEGMETPGSYMPWDNVAESAKEHWEAAAAAVAPAASPTVTREKTVTTTVS